MSKIELRLEKAYLVLQKTNNFASKTMVFGLIGTGEKDFPCIIADMKKGQTIEKNNETILIQYDSQYRSRLFPEYRKLLISLEGRKTVLIYMDEEGLLEFINALCKEALESK
jgi:hypothetical protein